MINFSKLKEMLATGDTLTIVATVDAKEIYTVSVSSKSMSDKKIPPVIVRGNAEELQLYFNTAFGVTAGAIKSFSSNADQVVKSMAKAKPGAKTDPKQQSKKVEIDNDDSDDSDDSDDNNEEAAADGSDVELASEKHAKDKKSPEPDLFSAKSEDKKPNEVKTETFVDKTEKAQKNEIPKEQTDAILAVSPGKTITKNEPIIAAAAEIDENESPFKDDDKDKNNLPENNASSNGFNASEGW